jgi:transcriptional regulator with XRE-family HTH domain
MTQASVEDATGDRPGRRGWTVDASSFGARLALIRQRMDWNLKEAALACNVPAQSWTNWERKDTDPRALLAVVRQISDRTGCDYLWLLAGPEGGVQ